MQKDKMGKKKTRRVGGFSHLAFLRLSFTDTGVGRHCGITKPRHAEVFWGFFALTPHDLPTYCFEGSQQHSPSRWMT